ncbi:hypothetical protein TBLA_0C06490 [Henningerozyma blattae CBS 6284]|uniref:BRCT domain-containing protein n=1 Tax=Henningerozyma blattae (strain ATCC 34711 / CBS 6284 / DSM 70876 / NBRC 10599 / NRRL Y-10934 / UCD 77-7) TaxID=1071380 RepID=I2H240_HENB6|nr:hypothetical protein TBLA_0C06490 [Tetrapisispora blattae CBS 6284]CCH60442.1 hypothetical protein TBLA_0C06490 [Tetrapisispora blattae CBS 6284]
MNDSELFSHLNFLLVFTDELAHQYSEISSLLKSHSANSVHNINLSLETSDNRNANKVCNILKSDYVHFIISNSTDFQFYNIVAFQLIIPVVTPFWLYDSIKKRKVIRPNKYSPDSRLILKNFNIFISRELPGTTPYSKRKKHYYDYEFYSQLVTTLGGNVTNIITEATTHIIVSNPTDPAINALIQYSHQTKKLDKVQCLHPIWLLRIFIDEKIRGSKNYDVNQTDIISDLIDRTDSQWDKLFRDLAHKKKQKSAKLNLRSYSFFIPAKEKIGLKLVEFLSLYLESCGGSILRSIDGGGIYSNNTTVIILAFNNKDINQGQLRNIDHKKANVFWIFNMYLMGYIFEPSSSLWDQPFNYEQLLQSSKKLNFSLSNYFGIQRFYIKKIIHLVNGNTTLNFSKLNDYLITPLQWGNKFNALKDINPNCTVHSHLWLEKYYRNYPTSEFELTTPSDLNKKQIRYLSFSDQKNLEDFFNTEDRFKNSALPSDESEFVVENKLDPIMDDSIRYNFDSKLNNSDVLNLSDSIYEFSTDDEEQTDLEIHYEDNNDPIPESEIPSNITSSNDLSRVIKEELKLQSIENTNNENQENSGTIKKAVLSLDHLNISEKPHLYSSQTELARLSTKKLPLKVDTADIKDESQIQLLHTNDDTTKRERDDKAEADATTKADAKTDTELGMKTRNDSENQQSNQHNITNLDHQLSEPSSVLQPSASSKSTETLIPVISSSDEYGKLTQPQESVQKKSFYNKETNSKNDEIITSNVSLARSASFSMVNNGKAINNSNDTQTTTNLLNIQQSQDILADSSLNTTSPYTNTNSIALFLPRRSARAKAEKRLHTDIESLNEFEKNSKSKRIRSFLPTELEKMKKEKELETQAKEILSKILTEEDRAVLCSVTHTNIPLKRYPYNINAICTGYEENYTDLELCLLRLLGIRIYQSTKTKSLDTIISPKFVRTAKFLTSLSFHPLKHAINPEFIKDILNVISQGKQVNYILNLEKYRLSEIDDELLQRTTLRTKVFERLKIIKINLVSNKSGFSDMISSVLKAHGIEKIKSISMKMSIKDALPNESDAKLQLKESGTYVKKRKTSKPDLVYICPKEHKLFRKIKQQIVAENIPALIVDWDWCVYCIQNLVTVFPNNIPGLLFDSTEKK